MVLILIGVCLLVYVMLLLPFRDVCLLSFMVFVKKLWRFSWTIFPSMELLLMNVYTTLVKFCRDVKKPTLFLIGRNSISWLMKGLFWDTRSLKEALKLTEPKLKQLRRCLVLEISKVFIVSLVMLVSIGGLLKISPKFQSPLLIFFKKMYLLFVTMIVRKPLKL